jgi:hypothetical protein
VTVTVETTFPGAVQILLLNTEYTTVPPAWKLLVRVAESETAFPTVMELEESNVDKVGLVLLTVRGSQALVAGPLFASPAYEAWKLKEPAGLGVDAEESGTTLLAPIVTA